MESGVPMRVEKGGIQIARVFGIPILVHFSWVVVFALIAWTLATGYFPEHDPNLPVTSYWARGLVASLLFFVSILLHELGHSYVAMRSGLVIRSITLFIFGGVAQLDSDPKDGRTEFRMAAAGPLVSLALAAVFYAAASLPFVGGATRAVSRYLSFINVVVAVFNLVPAFPLDGGRLMRGLLWRRLGRVKATRVAATAGTLFAYFLILTGALSLLRGASVGGVWQILIGWFLKEAALNAYRQVRLDETLSDVTVGDAMVRDVATIPGDISVAEAAREHFMRTGYGAYPVVRGDDVVGLLPLRDILKMSPEEREGTSVQGAMTPLRDELVAAPGDPVLEALARMSRSGLGRLLVLDDGRLVGVLSPRGVLRQLKMRQELG
jgi:Zn-dependent protease/predicted transcriptional regulator